MKFERPEILMPKPGPGIPDWTGVPLQYRGHVSAVVRNRTEAMELVKWYGSPNFAPFAPVLLRIPGQGWTFIVGDGWADAAELQELAIWTWDRALERIEENGGLIFDFAALREKEGLLPKEEAAAEMFEILNDRRKHHLGNRRTDPVRQMGYPDSGRKHFVMGDGDGVSGN